MELDNIPAPSHFPFFRRCVRAVFSRKMVYAIIAFITLVALFYAEEGFRGKRAWERYRQQAEARGLKLEFAEHIPAPVPDAENGANTPIIQSWFPKPKPDDTNRWPTLYSEADHLRVIKRKTKWPASQDDRALTDMTAWQQAFAALKEPKETRPKKIERTVPDLNRNAEEQARAALAVLEELKVYEPVLTELQAASKRPRVRFPVEYKMEEPFSILLPHLAKVKGLVQVLNLQACAELAAGKTDQAFEHVRLMFWLGDSMEDECFLISQLVRIAARQITIQPVWEGLAQHKWSEAQLKELQERLLRTDFTAGFGRSMDEERAGGIAAIRWLGKQKQRADKLDMFSEEGSPPPSNRTAKNLVAWFIPSGWFYFEMANYGIFMDRFTADSWDASSKTFRPRVVDENNRKMEQQFANGPIDVVQHHYIFARLLLPALSKASMRFSRAQSTANQAALACAIERFRLANEKLPESLATLVPKYIDHIPNEVVSEQPMRYLLVSDGFVLYSVGWDGVDDGGAYLSPINGKPEVIHPEKGDWVWRGAP